MLSEKYYNYFISSPPFDKCTSKEVDKLAKELASALTELESSRKRLECGDTDAIASSPIGQDAETPRNTSENDADTTQDINVSECASQAFESLCETPVSTSVTNPPQKRKKRLEFTPEVKIVSKKVKKEDHLQKSCDDCLVSGMYKAVK